MDRLEVRSRPQGSDLSAPLMLPIKAAIAACATRRDRNAVFDQACNYRASWGLIARAGMPDARGKYFTVQVKGPGDRRDLVRLGTEFYLP